MLILFVTSWFSLWSCLLTYQMNYEVFFFIAWSEDAVLPRLLLPPFGWAQESCFFFSQGGHPLEPPDQEKLLNNKLTFPDKPLQSNGEGVFSPGSGGQDVLLYFR